MSDDDKYRFRIEAYTPTTIPMSRLAEYLIQIAILLGNQDHVHFENLEEGSTIVALNIDNVAAPKVRNRLAALRDENPPEDALTSVNSLNEMLRDDNARGELLYGMGNVIPFPGKDIPKPEKLGPFNQDGKLDGVLMRIGGKDVTTVHATLISAEGKEWKCLVNKEQAKEMAHYLFGQPLRVFGTGRWVRDESGQWELLGFKVTHFTKVDDRDLEEAVKRLRQIEGSEWGNEEDPIGLLNIVRKGPDEVH